MIIQLKQIKTVSDMQWILKYNGQELATIFSPFDTKAFNAYLPLNGNQYRLYFNPFDKTYGAKFSDRFTFKIFNQSDILVGSICADTHRTGRLFGGYQYYKIVLNGEEFIGYEVGRGREGIALCLYKDNLLVSITDKNTTVINFQDEYTSYVLDKQYMDMTVLFAIYYDMTKFANYGQVVLYSQTQTYLLTTNNELKQKYDPDFIQRVKDMETKG